MRWSPTLPGPLMKVTSGDPATSRSIFRLLASMLKRAERARLSPRAFLPILDARLRAPTYPHVTPARDIRFGHACGNIE